MKNKFGMSSIIATVLIISITIVIIGAVFTFTVPFVQDSIKKSESCFNANSAIYMKSICHSTNDGILKNNPRWFSEGKINGAYQFNIGNLPEDRIPPIYEKQYIEVKNTPELNFGTNDFTLEAWIKTNNLENQSIIAKWNGSGTHHQAYWLAIFYKRFSFGVYNLSNNNSPNIVYSSLEIESNKWYHIMAERKKINDSFANISLYIDGKLDSSLIIPLSNVNNEETLKIGVDSPLEKPWYFNGLIDEVRIYNRALTPEEVLQNYNNQGKDYVPEGVISYWTFDKNTLSTTTDNGNILVKISRGSDEVLLNKLLFILKNKEGTLTYKISSDINKYEERHYQLAGLAEITSAQIAPIVLDGAKEITCEPNPIIKNIGKC